jgi:hypothetical protein
MKLKIYNVHSKKTIGYRYYSLFWESFIEELSKKYEVERVGFEVSEPYKFNIKTSVQDEPMYLYESDCLVENLETDEFHIMSVNDILHHNLLMEKSNPKLKSVFFSQFIRKHFISNVGQEFMYKYHPWIYFPFNTTNLEQFYYKRKTCKNSLKNKMFFKGITEDRPIIYFFNKQLLEFEKNLCSSENYFENLIEHKIALSIGGRGEKCYRDIECMAIGVPILRFEYQSEFNPELIPNYHYISVPLPKNYPKNSMNIECDRLGYKEHAEILEKRFLEVVDDVEFLEFIASNARDYYNNYLSHGNNVKYAIKLLGL